MTEFKAHFKSVQPDLGGSLPGRLIFGIPGKDGGYYLVAAEQVDANTIRFTFTPSQSGMPAVDSIDVDLPGATDEQIRKIIEEYLQNNPAIGQPGKDGFSPIAKVTQTADGAVVTITDKDGTTEAVITNGKNGYTPKKGIDYDDGKSAYEYAKEGGYTRTETEFSEKLAKEYPEKVSQLVNDSQYINAAGAPVQSINGKTGKVHLGAADVGARPSSWMPTAQEVGALPDTYVPPDQTAAQVGADPAGTAAAAVGAHNTSTDSHGDLRLELKAINDRLTAFFDSDNQTLDELSEIVAYITSNKALIDSITTSKVSVADIINNLTTNVANKPLSAAQGVALKGLIDAVSSSLSNYQPKGDYALRSELPTVPTKVSQLKNDKGYLTEHQDISGKLDADKLPEAVNNALAQAKESGEFDGEKGDPGVTPHIGTNGNWYIGSADTGVKAQGKYGTSVTVKSVSESTADGGSNVVTFSDGKTLTVKNGKQGSAGKTPIRGVDYYTEADKSEIVAEVIEKMGGSESLIVSYTDGKYTTNDGDTKTHNSLTLVEAHGLIPGRKLHCTLWVDPGTISNICAGYDANGTYAVNGNTFSWTALGNNVYECVIPANVAILKFNIYTTQKETAVCYMPTDEEDTYTPSYITHSVAKPLGFSSGKKLIAFGDSITAGVFSSASGISTTYDSSYIILLCNKLGLTLTNKALSGTTLANVAHPTEATLTADKSIYGQVTATNLSTYDFIVVAGGCNDGALQTTVGELGSTDNKTTYGALEAMCEYIAANKKSTAQVIFIAPIPLLKDLSIPLATYRNAVFEVAVKHGFNVVDGYKLGFPYEAGDFADEVFPDGCHPSLAGHKMYANSLLGVLVGETGGTVDPDITTEDWTFTLADGSTVTKAVCLK